MKKFRFLQLSLIVAITLFITSCSKDLTRAEVIKDCTGTYVQIDEKAYLVCNFEILESYATGDAIKISFKNVSECPAIDSLVICEMYHQYYGVVKINEIK